MRKNKYLLIVVVVMLFVISGCSKNKVDADKMSEMFIDKFIYDKEDENFDKSFVEGDLLSKQLTLMTKTFEDTFSDVFDSVVGNLSDEEKNKISASLMDKVRKESNYTSTVKEVDKNKVEVTYKIQGFDYASLVENTLASVFTKLMKEESATDDQMKQGLLDSFDEALVNAKSVDNVVNIKLVFEQVKGQWQIYDDQDEELEQILLAFVAGVNDKEQYESEMAEMLERALEKATAE